MTLRFMLVGIVASMGFEMPTAQDLASWSRSGCNWFDARMADVSCLQAEAARALELVTDCERVDDPALAPAPLAASEVAPTGADLTFDAVVDGMARDFSADLASIEAEKSFDVEEYITIVEPFEEMLPAVASEPQPAPTPEPVVEAIAEADPEPEPAMQPALTPVSVVQAESRVAKISSAVRLTRQALGAWAALIQPSPSADQADDEGEDDPL